MKFILKHLPFVGIIAINSLAIAGRFRPEVLKPFLLAISTVIVVNLVVAIIVKVRSYFLYGISVIVILGTFSVFFLPPLGQVFLRHAITFLYVGLFCAAFFPPLFTIEPFTYEFSKKQYPEVITQTAQFRKINLIMNYIWAALFVTCIILTEIIYSDDGGIQIIVSGLVPIILLLSVGIPLNRKLPAFLIQSIPGEPMYFKSAKELFEAMPHGLNKKAAQGIDTIVQFRLTGEEPTDGYLIIKNMNCTYSAGIHPNPKTTINCDSRLWLAISNKEISGDQAYLNKEYTVDGDMTLLLKFNDLFDQSGGIEEEIKPNEIKFEYKTITPKSIQKIIVFDGGPRNSKFSKTSFMANHFCKGAESAGAAVEFVRLKDMKINPCSGCYSCWTKTPGQCIFKDDMTELRKKFRKADLVVFASPLYIFNVTGIMKNFLDRLLPNMKPYMLLKEGLTLHPHRYSEDNDQVFVVFSAAGFPEVEHNFDGLKAMFRCLHSHSEKAFLMGEFYLPGAELIAQPVYADRRKKVKQTCYDAGRQCVMEGKIKTESMQTVATMEITQAKFGEQADYFWESLDGKSAFLASAPELEDI